MSTDSSVQLVHKIGIPMDARKLEAIRVVKSKIASMLKERHELSSHDRENSEPSEVWTAGCSLFDYLIDLPDKSFSKLRLHTYYLTSDYYLPYVLGKGLDDIQGKWERYVKGVPDKYRINEPEGGIGFEVSGIGMISHDSVRYQKTISAFYHNNLISPLESEKNACVLEIGGGYGALVHHLAKVSNATTYLIVDLPETLLFSAAYISMLNPEKSVYLYDENDFDEIINNDISSFDFMFIPNYKLSQLTHLEFDLAINLNSLGEMTTNQVQEYVDFVFKTCTGSFYSHNQDHLEQNLELENLTDMLEKKFQLVEVPSSERTVASIKAKINKLINLASMLIGKTNRRQFFYYREYIGTPRK